MQRHHSCEGVQKRDNVVIKKAGEQGGWMLLLGSLIDFDVIRGIEFCPFCGFVLIAEELKKPESGKSLKRAQESSKQIIEKYENQ